MEKLVTFDSRIDQYFSNEILSCVKIASINYELDFIISNSIWGIHLTNGSLTGKVEAVSQNQINSINLRECHKTGLVWNTNFPSQKEGPFLENIQADHQQKILIERSYSEIMRQLKLIDKNTVQMAILNTKIIVEGYDLDGKKQHISRSFVPVCLNKKELQDCVGRMEANLKLYQNKVNEDASSAKKERSKISLPEDTFIDNFSKFSLPFVLAGIVCATVYFSKDPLDK